MGFDATQLVAGVIFGLAVAMLGGWADYRRMRGNPDAHTELPPLIMPVAGILSLFGLVAFAVSLVVTGSLRPAAVIGLGVGLGFTGGFAVLFLLYLLTRRS